MNITGRDLEFVLYALELACVELHNCIATCPDVVMYAEEIEDYENDLADIRLLQIRVNKSLENQS